MPIDIICIAAFAFGCWQGYSQGIIGTLFNFLAYVFGSVIAFKMAPVTADLLERLFNSHNPAMYIAALLVNILVILFILRQAANGMESLFEAAYLGHVNKLAGAALSGGFLIMVFSVILWFLAKVQFLSTATLAESKTYPLLEKIPPRAKEIAIRFGPVAEGLWDDSMKWINRLETYGTKQIQSEKPKIYEIPDQDAAIEDHPDAADDSPPARIYKPEDTGTGIEEN
jgi:uncharacterized membrane protein required for colicin V production